MKAIVCSRYGPPEDLVLRDVPVPVPRGKQVLVRIHATSVNDYDQSMIQGRPLLYRLFYGLFRPKRPIPGMELAGTVEAVGPASTRFRVGDAVYGDISDHGFGSFAEFVTIHEDALRLKPAAMPFAEATTIPHAALLAHQALFRVGQLQAGQRVLINGAGGGVGSFAVQFAKELGAEVTGVDKGPKLEAMRLLGFDHVIDHQLVDFTRTGEQYDLVLDCRTTRAPKDHLRVLRPDGMYVTIGGEVGRLIQLLFAKLFGMKRVHILALRPNEGLDEVEELYAAGRIKAVVDGPYPLAEAPRMIRYFMEGRHHGKVVLEILPDE